jgi:hypothetical protein
LKTGLAKVWETAAPREVGDQNLLDKADNRPRHRIIVGRHATMAIEWVFTPFRPEATSVIVQVVIFA